MTTIGVVIADDQALLRGGFRVLIDAAPDMRILGEAADGAAAVALVRDQRPDVVLMDIRMPDVDGIEATRRIKADETTAQTRVLILTTFDLDQYVYAALRAGASGFMLKDTSPEELLAGIRIVAAGDGLLSPSVTRRLIERFATGPEAALPNPAVLDQITDREREVLVEVSRGLSNVEIAEHLHMSAATAKTHVSHLFTKLRARDRAQLVVIAYESGLASPR
ncbi:MAG: DNA-binding response regulator [Actinomycetia bacterium]|nr:DNA-binding response regulator [Actinomycetes bacterium]